MMNLQWIFSRFWFLAQKKRLLADFFFLFFLIYKITVPLPGVQSPLTTPQGPLESQGCLPWEKSKKVSKGLG